MRPTLSIILLSAIAALSSAMTIPPNMNTQVSLSKYRDSKHPALLSNGRNSNLPLAMAIPGYGVTEQIFVGGFANFLSIYNILITVRVLLSWFPQAQGVGALQPVFAVTDPYLNAFRGIIPPVFGLDLSPLLAFFTLNVLGQVTASVGCEIPEGVTQKLEKRFGLQKGVGKLGFVKN